jgi:Restriction endonuclease
MRSEQASALPDEDAEDHIKDVLNLCSRTEEDDSPQEDEERQLLEPTSWELLTEQLLENPTPLVHMGIITQREIEECGGEIDEELASSVALALLVGDWASQQAPAEYDEYEGQWSDRDDEGYWINESIVNLRYLISAAERALASADAEGLISAMGAIYDEIGWEPESLDYVNNWAQLLINAKESSTGDAQKAELEHQIVNAIKSLAVRLCEIIARDGTALQYLEWRQLEEIVAEALEGIGFDVTLTPSAKDGGKDVVATCILRGKRLRFFVEIKHWRSGKRVGIKPIIDFVEINLDASTDGGLFLSTSGFGGRVFTHLAELECSRIRLGGGKKVAGLCQHFVRRRRGIWTATSSLPEILFEGTLEK